MGHPPEEFKALLEAVLPGMGLVPGRFRRKNVQRRVRERLTALKLYSFRKYLEVVESNPAEEENLHNLLVVTVTRFFRNRSVFQRIARDLLPALPESGTGGSALRFWSAGCAGGEEAYSLAILLEEAGWDAARCEIVATDIDEASMKRAKQGFYGKGSLKEVEPGVLEKYFSRRGETFLLSHAVRSRIRFLRHDILREEPLQDFSLVLCRNLAFTYFDRENRMKTARHLHRAVLPGGCLVIGKKEQLPAGALALFRPLYTTEKIYRRVP